MTVETALHDGGGILILLQSRACLIDSEHRNAYSANHVFDLLVAFGGLNVPHVLYQKKGTEFHED